jgi:hypothetical protein
MAVRKRSAVRKTTTRKLTRKKATRKKKLEICDSFSTTQAEAFQLLTNRLGDIYRRAEERAADIGGEMRDEIDELAKVLDEKIDALTSQTTVDIEDLLDEVEGRNAELQDRVPAGCLHRDSR